VVPGRLRYIETEEALMRVSLACLLLAACAPTPPAEADASAVADARVSVDALPGTDAGVCTDVIDVVFVLDVSSSMGFVLDQLEQGIGEVVTAANGLAPDAHFGLVPYVDNFAFDLSGDLEGGLVHTAATTLQAAFAEVRATYTDENRNPGDGPTGPTTQNPICEEDAIDALYAAAATYPWRENATRVIILATDDTFLERPDNYGDRDGDGDTTSTDYPREGDYPALRTLAETVTALRAARVRVFAFTRLAPPSVLDLSRCGTGRRLPWESVSDGWSTTYAGATPIPEATDAANFDLDLVRDGDLSLKATINQVVLDSYCNPPVP
jgi:hypothetical protein